MLKLLFAALLVVLIPNGGGAIESHSLVATPFVGGDPDVLAQAGLPQADAFGDGWRVDLARAADPLEDSTSPRFQVWYTHPNGSRIYIVVGIYGSSISEALSLTASSDQHIKYLEDSLSDSFNTQNAEQLAGQAAPSGCASAVRAEGIESSTLYPVGAVSCLDESNGRVLTITVSGHLPNAFGGYGPSLTPAADVVTEAVLAVSPESPLSTSTPLPATPAA